MKLLVAALSLFAAVPCALAQTSALRIAVLAAAGDASECTAAGGKVRLGDPSRSPGYNLLSQLPTCETTASTVGDCFFACGAAAANATAKAFALAEVSKVAALVAQLVRTAAPRAGGVTVANRTSACPEPDVAIGVAANASLTSSDFALVVTTRPGMESSALPYGRTCQVEGGVPSVGYVNVDPARVAAWPDVDRSRLLFQAILQALAFNDYLFSLKLGAIVTEQRNLPQPPRAGTGASATYEVAYLATPEVRAAARAHFGCDTLPGAELENGWPEAGQNFKAMYPQGGRYRRRSLLEKRVFGPEALTRGPRSGASAPASATGAPTDFVISAITHAAIRDAGFTTDGGPAVQPLLYGQRMGCGFATKSCFETTCQFLVPQTDATDRCAEHIEHATDYFCASSLDAGAAQTESCSFDLRGKSVCPSLKDYPQAIEPWNYFKAKPSSGGADPLSDFCPVTVADPALDCRLGAGAAPAATTSSVARGEVRGADAACFLSSVIDANVTDTGVSRDYRPTCYRFRCVSRTVLQYQLAGSRAGLWYTCIKDGENPPLNDKFNPDVRGRVRCPRIDTLCGAYDPATSPAVPVIDKVDPARGDYRGGQTVTITGKDLPVGADVVVEIAGVEATECSVKSATQYVCVTGKEERDPSELGPGFVRIFSRSSPDDGAAAKDGYFPFEVTEPSKAPEKVEEEGNSGFFQKDCIGIKCWIIPLIFLGLSLPCCAWRFLRKKKPKKDAKKLNNDDDDGIQL